MIRIGARASALARRQAEIVEDALKRAWPGLCTEIRAYSSDGDRDQLRSLPEIGGKGLFTADIEQALRAGEIDLAVHSLKDMPICSNDGSNGLSIGAILAREEAGDVLVSRHGLPLAQLPPGARIGTCSPRRAAQLLAHRPDLGILPLRGNIETRLRKSASCEYDGIILAAAGLIRLGRASAITEWLSIDIMLPAPGQGALAVQCRGDDLATLESLWPLHDPLTAAAVNAERAFLGELGGGCAAPVAAYATCLPAEGGLDARLWLRGAVSGPVAEICGESRIEPHAGVGTGERRLLRVSVTGELHEPYGLGRRAASEALAAGALALMEGR